MYEYKAACRLERLGEVLLEPVVFAELANEVGQRSGRPRRRRLARRRWRTCRHAARLELGLHFSRLRYRPLYWLPFEETRALRPASAE